MRGRARRWAPQRGPVTVAAGGAWTLQGVEVFGSVHVGPGASLRMEDCLVHGRLEVADTSLVLVRSSVVSGHVLLAASSDDGAGGTIGLVDTTVSGDVRAVARHDTKGRTHTRLVLGHGTVVTGNVVTAWVDIHDGGATLRGALWDTTSPASTPVQATVSQPSAASAASNGSRAEGITETSSRPTILPGTCSSASSSTLMPA